MVYLSVFLGGFFGAVARYSLSKTIGQAWQKSYPLGTFIINITGSFLLGFLITLFTNRAWPHTLQAGLTTGFIGAYTTFSTFSYESIQLLMDSEWLNTFLYVILSLIVALIMSWLGIQAARLF